MPKYRVGVIYGSRSTEHEVSIVSAMQVIKFLAGRHDITPIYISKDGHWLTGHQLLNIAIYKDIRSFEAGLNRLVITPDTDVQALANPMGGLLQRPKKIQLDVAFPILHGSHGEDGTIQGVLELSDIPYVGSRVGASAICIDKVTTKAVLKENGFSCVEYVSFTRSQWISEAQTVVEQVSGEFAFPLIVKPAKLGSSVGVSIAHDEAQFRHAVDTAVNFDQRIVVEPYLQEAMEVNCAVLGNDRPIPSVCEQPLSSEKVLSYEDKYMHESRARGIAGAERIIPAPIDEKMTQRIQDLAVNAFLCTGCSGLARVDFLVDKVHDRVYVNEINTIPGSISFYLWEKSGISPEDLVDRLLDLAFESYKERRTTTFSLRSPLLDQPDLLGSKV